MKDNVGTHRSCVRYLQHKIIMIRFSQLFRRGVFCNHLYPKQMALFWRNKTRAYARLMRTGLESPEMVYTPTGRYCHEQPETLSVHYPYAENGPIICDRRV